jgi:hypothetical protein
LRRRRKRVGAKPKLTPSGAGQNFVLIPEALRACGHVKKVKWVTWLQRESISPI